MPDRPKPVHIPSCCPLCGDAIEVTQIQCGGCHTSMNGVFKPGDFGLLPIEYQKFISVFLRQRGNIKAVEKELGISYPTINKMLDSINKILKSGPEQTPLSRREVLDAIEKGDTYTKDAAYILKTRR